MLSNDEQLSLFNDNEKKVVNRNSEPDDILPYEIGDKIRIHLSITEEEDPESYHYLKEWEGKQGIIKEIIKKPRLQYKTLFKEREVFLYHHEITI
ncbi:hypothetical protein [Bacillus sp. FJAT-29937]|uniref:hypothetical protein n=1 Tax=Bacillus sp. FJAT-29937 TaxID=1720553 RepID=UPI00082A95A0|nr:hypothetical protein [Bacillus sp. FJAT-29937]